MIWIIYFFIVIVGTVLGSFFNVCIYRIPRHESIVFPASHCPVCNAKIKIQDNIPIIGYLLLKGKCRNCGAKISLIYPIIELITPLLFVLLFIISGNRFSPFFWKYSVFISFGILIFSIDVQHKIVPNILSLPMILIGLLFALFPARDVGLISAVGSAAFGFTTFLILAYLFKIFTKKEALGGGDIKLIAALGSFVGFYGILFTMVFASIFALIFILVFKKDKSAEIPFAPFLIASAVSYVFCGGYIIGLYAKIFIL